MGPKKFCGYVGIDGKPYVLRFWSIGDIHAEYASGKVMPGVAGMGPFQCPSAVEALKIVKKKYQV